MSSSSSSKPSGKSPIVKELRERRSIQSIQAEYDNETNVFLLENLVTAFLGIQVLPESDPNSFWALATAHGQPFSGAGCSSSSFWGGYCHHGNILFPLWHRIYCLKWEEALQSIVPSVTLPYWDELSTSKRNVLPTCLTDATFSYKSKKLILNPNPLASYRFPRAILDYIDSDENDFSKRKDYVTKRYPLSGLDGTTDRDKTEAHNAQYPDPIRNTELLNQNVWNWLDKTGEIDGKPYGGGREKYLNSLNAPNYTVFSNVTSENHFNSVNVDSNGELKPPERSLEGAHDQLHNAIGFHLPVPPYYEHDPLNGASGDLGGSDYASFDPIFPFHHAFIDYVFWEWQKKKGQTVNLEITPEYARYPGTNSVDRQGPTPGVSANTWLNLETPLEPFTKPGSTPANPVYYKGSELVNIESDPLNYKYEKGSIETEAVIKEQISLANANPSDYQTVAVTGINRSNIAGSFIISLFGKTKDGHEVRLGADGVFSRWSVSSCSNCQNHLETRAFFSIPRTFFDHSQRNLNGEPELEVRLNVQQTGRQKYSVEKLKSVLIPQSKALGKIGSQSLVLKVTSTPTSGSGPSSSK